MLTSPGGAGEPVGGGGAHAAALAVLIGSADATFVLGPRHDPRAVYRRRPARAGILGNRPLEAIHPDDLGRVLDVLARVRERPRSTEALTVRARDEAGHWADVHFVVAYGEGTEGVVLQVHVLAARSDDATLPSAAEIAPAGISIGDDFGRPLYANAWLRERLPPADGGVPGWLEAAVDRATAETLVRNARAGLSGEADLWFDLLDGRHCLRVRVEPHRSATGDVAGVLSTFVDLTEEVEIRRRLQRSERVQATMLAGLAEGVAVIDADGDLVLDANEAAHELAGVPPGAMVGARLSDFWGARVEASDGGPQRPGGHHIVGVARAGGAPEALTVRFVRPDGEPRWFSLAFRPVPEAPGVPPRIVLTFTDVTDRQEHTELLTRRASHDALTGLPNRASILAHLDGALARRRRLGAGLCAVLFCDLDGFKAVNDTFGHQTGDRVLVVAADRIRVSCRDADRVGRLGGDEFVVVLEDLHDPGEIWVAARRIVSALREPISVGDAVAELGVSIGAVTSAGADEAGSLLAQADAAMYEAKQAGGSTWVGRSAGRAHSE